MTRSVSLRLAALVTAASAIVLVAGAALTVSRASAVWFEIAETGRPGMLQLRVHSETPLRATLGPGEAMRWAVEASLADAERGSLTLELRSEGDLAERMTAEVVACTLPFESVAEQTSGAPASGAPTPCPGEASLVLARTPLASVSTHDGGDLVELAELRAGEPRYLLVTLALPEGSAVSEGAAARVGLGLHAAGASPAEPPEPPAPPTSPPDDPERPELAATGGDLAALAALGAGVVGLAAGTALLRRARAAGSGGDS